jgi:hypothetical protein
MDHLVKTVAKICHDSQIAQGLACERTKSTAIVKHILAQHSFDFLCTQLRKKKFSLIVDESTDRTTEKHLCLTVRYLDNNYCAKDDFFGLIKLSGTDTIDLYNHIISVFKNNDIPYKNNLIGFASDGGNVQHHFLMTQLKKDVPYLFVMKCICHSFHLCASYACFKLPRFVEDLTRDIYNYFSSIPKRISKFTEFQNFCNLKIHKFLHPSQTRWLSVKFLVSRILQQYSPLQLYFRDTAAKGDVLAADYILKKLNDPTSKLFLQFLDFVLDFFNDLNREMQSESPKLHTVYKNISNVLKTIFDCFIKRDYLLSTPLEEIDFKTPTNYIVIEEVYFGVKVSQTIADGNFSAKQLHYFRDRCLQFYVEACSQITKRFPLKDNFLKSLEFLDPEIVKSGSVSSISHVATRFPNLIVKNVQSLDNEWRLLRNVSEIQALSNDLCTFWQAISKLKLGDESPRFPTLTNFVFNIICLPHSSATVERLFSAINLMKNKERNKLSSETISALLLTKRLINNNCHEFHIGKKLINSMTNKNLCPNTIAD